MDMEIIPAILVAELNELKQQLKWLEELRLAPGGAGLISRVQIDIIDEEFAEKQTIKMEELEKVACDWVTDVHLMVKEPIHYLNRCDQVGVERVYGQIELMGNVDEFVDQATSLGMEVGLALDLETEVDLIKKQLSHVDGVLLMAVPAGAQGQKFDDKVLAKIVELRTGGFREDVCVDGGLNVETVRFCWEKGANHFAVGSFLWRAKNLQKQIEKLKQAGRMR
jgi:ribulose-phosphate 3-epimerase